MADRGWTEMFGALREREFDRLLTGQVVSTTGEAMIPVALSFAVLDMTDSPTDVGIVLAAGVVAIMRPRPVVARLRRRAFFTELAAGWCAFRSRTWLWLLVIEFSVFGLAVYGPFTVLGPVPSERRA